MVDKDRADTETVGSKCLLCKGPTAFDPSGAPFVGVTLSGYNATLKRDVTGMSLRQFERLAEQSGFTPIGDANLREITQEVGSPEDRIKRKQLISPDKFREMWNRTEQIAISRNQGDANEFSDT